MDDAWHRLGVFLDLREDPDLETRRESERPRHRLVRIVRGALEVAVFIAICVLLCGVLALIVHLIIGGDTSPGAVLVDGLRFFAVALTIAMVAFFLGRWLYWFADRWIRKG